MLPRRTGPFNHFPNFSHQPRSISLLRSSLLLLLFLLSLFSPLLLVLGSEQLAVLQPNLFPQTNGILEQRPSLFGLANYREKLIGQVIYPERGTNNLGCLPYSPFLPPDRDADRPVSGSGSSASLNLIALIDRGNCSFSLKVQRAQDAGARAVIVVNNDAVYGDELPYMAAGPEGTNLRIPAMIIHGRDGDILKANLDAGSGIQVAMSYFLPPAGNRVEFELYTYASDPLAVKFRQQFRQVVLAFGKHALFQPHYQILTQYYTGSGSTATCKPSSPAQQCDESTLNSRCGNSCINCGQYCAIDPDGDPNAGASGGDVVIEQIRQKCVWQYGNETKPYANTLWFDYLESYSRTCTGARKFTEICGNSVAIELGVPLEYIVSCIGPSNYTTDALIPVAEADLKWQNMFQPISQPELFVNQQPYRGELSCPEPVDANCPPLQMICAGFRTGTAPSVCDTWSQGGGEVQTSFPYAIVIGIIGGSLVLIGIVVWIYLRRQKARMKDDIDALLKQYLPLDHAAPGPISGPLAGGSRHPFGQSHRVDPTRLLSREELEADGEAIN